MSSINSHYLHGHVFLARQAFDRLDKTGLIDQKIADLRAYFHHMEKAIDRNEQKMLTIGLNTVEQAIDISERLRNMVCDPRFYILDDCINKGCALYERMTELKNTPLGDKRPREPETFFANKAPRIN